MASAKWWALCHELRMNTVRSTAFNSCLDQWGVPWWSFWVEWVLGSHLVQLVVEKKDAFYIIWIISVQLLSQFSSILTTFLCILLYFLPSHPILASASITSVLLLLSFMAMAVHPKGLSNIQISSFGQSLHLTLLLDILDIWKCNSFIILFLLKYSWFTVLC